MRGYQDALPSQARVQKGDDVREFDPASSQQAIKAHAWGFPASKRPIDDVEPRDLSLQLVVADFREQNHGLGLHGVLLSLSSGPAARPR